MRPPRYAIAILATLISSCVVLTRGQDPVRAQSSTHAHGVTSADAFSHAMERSDSLLGVSTLMDTWLLLRNVEFNGERNRTIYVLKSRGMAHSNQVREFVLSDDGIDLVDVYAGADRVLTGSARLAQETHERGAAEVRRQDHTRKLLQLAAKRKAIEAQIAALQVEAEAEAAEVDFAIAQETLQEKTTQKNTNAMAQLRGGATNGTGGTIERKLPT